MKHAFTSTKPPVADPTKVGSREWDQPHIIVGRTVSANFTCTTDDDLILATGGSAGISCTPLPSAPDGTVFIVMKFDAGPGGVTILGTINGQTNFVLTDRWQFVELLAYSGTWLIVRGGVAATAGSLAGAVLLAPTANQIISASASQALISQSVLSGSSIKIYSHDPVFGIPFIQLDSNTTGQAVISWTKQGVQDFALYRHGSGPVLGIFDNSILNDALTIFGGLTSLRDLAIGGPGVLNGRVRLFGLTSGTASRTVNATSTQVIEDTALQVPALNIVSLGVHANNAAALAASLVAGDLYRTGADPDVVCVVH